MAMTYQFIDKYLAESLLEPTFVIPRLRWIAAGVAIATGNTGQKALLLEEYIEAPEHGFVKYVHNGEAVPLLDPTDTGYETAQFLCFTQHVQWEKTSALAYISDFQGYGSLLTDPQIMTHPSLGDLFAAGNVPEAFERFPTEHICNDFCTWFDLALLEPSHSSTV
ncbi:hypothetical protein CALVIDRAFT_563142 [Calocera viscosa TUFC12733]|uniref:Alpha-type protein kinase domain-containing protein n=1 Tax=Calocera viscosa (strain TUFC12733) TaxID=1330018 RepID=A0A167N536_CALVF|nr:hypothetical protein CALVIDRAFT_563142 [Calocera viscosa TUFC12733]